MEKERVNKKKSVRIPCAKIVHDYTKATLKKLGNLRCTDVYRTMKHNGGIVLYSHSKAVQDIDKLITCTDTFLPSVPMTGKDVDESRRFLAEWKKSLQQIRKQLMCTCKPVYLQTEVARLLRERKSKVKFHEVMLEWYLSRYGGDNLTPEKIADAVIEHEGTDWRNVRPLAKGKTGYNIRLDVDTKEEKNIALKYIQWIYKLDTEDVSSHLLDDLENDLKVVKDFEVWRDNDPKDYEYSNTYKEYISRLRTAPKFKSEQEPLYQVKANDAGSQSTDNYTELISYLKTISPRVYYLEGNLKEGKNPEYIQKFASRDDFRAVFNTLKQHTADGTSPQARTIMQFIRNVANYNILEWGAPAPIR